MFQQLAVHERENSLGEKGTDTWAANRWEMGSILHRSDSFILIKKQKLWNNYLSSGCLLTLGLSGHKHKSPLCPVLKRVPESLITPTVDKYWTKNQWVNDFGTVVRAQRADLHPSLWSEEHPYCIQRLQEEKDQPEDKQVPMTATEMWETKALVPAPHQGCVHGDVLQAGRTTPASAALPSLRMAVGPKE